MRLRKYVVEDEVTETVPVRREEVRIEREPITDANVGDALDGPAISGEEHEVAMCSSSSTRRLKSSEPRNGNQRRQKASPSCSREGDEHRARRRAP